MSSAGQNQPKSFLKSHLILLLAAAAVLLIALLWPLTVISKPSLGQCMSLKGVTMFGADSCENCANQKKLFGEDFKNIRYVNCEFNIEQCRQKGVSLYPEWEMNGNVLVGTQTLPDLAKFAGCEYKD